MMSLPTVQFSELSRASKSVAEAADLGPVPVTRRDGEPLVLQRKSEVDRQSEGVELAVSAWRSTAEAYARGPTPDEDLEWLPEPVAVERPTI